MAGLDLSEAITEVLQECIARGMQSPFVVSAMSPNGSVTAFRFLGPSEEMETLAEHFEDEGFVLPINIIVMDQAGAAERVVISPGRDSMTWH
jgi:hypothetical protein